MPPNHVALLIDLFADVLDGRNAYVEDSVQRVSAASRRTLWTSPARRPQPASGLRALGA
jgi:hypothetical protein